MTRRVLSRCVLALTLGAGLPVAAQDMAAMTAPAPRSGPAAQARYSGEKLSLNFQNIDVRAVLQVIADFTKLNIVTSDSVTGSVTLRLKDVPWDQALDTILQAKGLAMRRSGDVVWVATREELLAREAAELETQKKLAELEPLQTRAFQLNYAKSEAVARALGGQALAPAPAPGGATAAALAPLLGGAPLPPATRMLSERGSVLFEPRTNQLFVTDVPARLEAVRALIERIDIPVRQVLIEARIVEADERFGRALGARLGLSDLRGAAGDRPGFGLGGGTFLVPGGNYNAVGAATGQGAAATYNDTRFVNLPANSAALGTAAPAATFALTLFRAASNRFLNLELSALEADGRGRVLSSPRVVTADQVKAEIEQGEEIPYQSGTSSGATQVEFKKASLRLEVTPQITPEGNVILDVLVSKDSRGALTPTGPAINTKRVRTQVLVENGGTVALGGILAEEERHEANKVPVLGDLPGLGALFRDTVRARSKTELLVFITPQVVAERAPAR
ncbi:type IV pilus secretin PilQ [Azohydromonas caseinilytica]|uniref:Type IV pilus secretin PilQ family protein n=1 Tax=Azohydromonas caseinilytica TaxID=2728836 RepID=A0A848F218_9BURK|nr:type IV pilus secretin PilQ family protein [Azohydromonas caseinilytica]NML13452.1 type IV pilus secretin PilQ family protein [Azohydromonas caseinilytica]